MVDFRTEGSQQAILRAAKEIFAERGFDGTTIDDVAHRAGTAKGAVLMHYPDKQSLLVGAFNGDIDAAMDDAFRAMPRRAAAMQKMLFVVRELFRFHAKDHTQSRMLMKEVMFLRGSSGRLFDRQIGRFIAEVTRLLEQAKATGEIREDLNSKRAAAALFSFYLFATLEGLRAREFDVDAQVGTVEALVAQQLEGYVIGKTRRSGSDFDE